MWKTGAKTFGRKASQTYLCRPLKRPVRLRARTPPFHGGDTGSNPVRATKKTLTNQRLFLLYAVMRRY